MTRYVFGRGIPDEEMPTVGSNFGELAPTARQSQTGASPAPLVYRARPAHAKPARAKHAGRGFFNVRRR